MQQIYQKSKFLLSLSLLVLMTLLSACNPTVAQPPTTTPVPPQTSPVASTLQIVTPDTSIILTDGLGRKVTLKQPAQRVISLAPSNTEILFALGAAQQVVGRDDFSNYPPEATSLPSIGGIQKHNLEEIVRLQPDLVLAAGINSAEQVKDIEELGITIFLIPNPKNFEELYTNINTVATLVGKQENATQLVQQMKEQVEKTQNTVQKVIYKPKVFYELDGSDPTKPWTSGPGTFVDMLINMAGGQNIGASLQGEWAQISQEELLVQNPDIILLGDSLFGMTVEEVIQRPGWKDMKAVQEQRVYPFNDDLVSRPGPRLSDGLLELAKIIHSDLKF